jgi:uncharacterized protein YcbX
MAAARRKVPLRTLGCCGHQRRALYVYPVKSCRGVAVPSSAVEPWGLAGDRRWMVVDEQGGFLTQRKAPRLALVRPELRDDGGVCLRAPDLPPLAVAAPVEGERVRARVWRDDLVVRLAAAEAHAWLVRHLGRPARLVWLDDPRQRPVDRPYGRARESVSFADGFPLLLASAASLDHLNGWLDEPLPMNRFRPNLVVSGSPAWAEDKWRRLRVGPVVLRVAKPCGRCVVTTTDQETLERGPEPLRALAAYRNFGGQLVFGQNLVPETTGTIRVGDPVEVT